MGKKSSISIHLRGVEATFNQLEKDLDEEVSVKLLPVVNAAVVALKYATPIDTGKARNGWHYNTLFGGKYVLRNNVEYLPALNAGHSAQAGPFFIERTLLRFGKPKGLLL